MWRKRVRVLLVVTSEFSFKILFDCHSRLLPRVLFVDISVSQKDVTNLFKEFYHYWSYSLALTLLLIHRVLGFYLRILYSEAAYLRVYSCVCEKDGENGSVERWW